MQICDVFPRNEENIAVVKDFQDLQAALESLSVDFLDRFELDQILVEGSEIKSLRKSSKRPEPGNICENESTPIAYLIAGSTLLRKTILNLKTNATYCALVETKLGSILSESQLKKLSENAIEFQSDRHGTVIYTTSSKEFQWFVLVSGKMRANAVPVAQADHEEAFGAKSTAQVTSVNISHDVIAGDIFGGVPEIRIETKSFQVNVEVASQCTWFMLRSDDLIELMDECTEAAEKVFVSIEGMHILLPDLCICPIAN